MNWERTRIVTWVGFILLTSSVNAGASSIPISDHSNSTPIECPLGDMEDPNTSESESENDKETDDDNIFEGKYINAFWDLRFARSSCEWDLIHDDPWHNHNSPPPKSVFFAHS
jgi:hypothetical protein